MLFEELAEGGVAAGAALAGPGRAADVAERAQLQRLNRPNDFGFSHLQATTDDAFGAAVADFVGMHDKPGKAVGTRRLVIETASH